MAKESKQIQPNSKTKKKAWEPGNKANKKPFICQMMSSRTLVITLLYSVSLSRWQFPSRGSSLLPSGKCLRRYQRTWWSHTGLQYSVYDNIYCGNGFVVKSCRSLIIGVVTFFFDLLKHCNWFQDFWSTLDLLTIALYFTTYTCIQWVQRAKW